MTNSNNNIAAMQDILNHDSQIGIILDCSEDLKVMKQSTIDNTKNRVYGGIESKQDYRMMYSAEREEDDWNYFAQRYGLELMPVMHKPQEFISAEVKKPTAKIKRKPTKSGSYHYSYVGSTPRHEKLEKEFTYRLKLEDDLDIKPIDNPYADPDNIQLIKVVRFEYRDPYIIVVAKNVEDEHKRLTQTRSLDEVSEIYFTFDVRPVKNDKGQKVENPELRRLGSWLKSKVNSEAHTYLEALEQVVDRIYMISTQMNIIVNGKSVPNPDFIGFSRYTLDDLYVLFDKTTKDYVGSYSNVHISNRQIANDNGELRFVESADSVDVYYGDKLERTYKIAE